MKKALKAVYWTAFILEIITLIPWTIIAWSGGTTAFELILSPDLTTLSTDIVDFGIHLLMILPMLLTLAIFIIHINSYRELKKQGYVSRKLIGWQSAVGIAIAIAFSFTVFSISNLDCIDACTHPPDYWATTSLPIALAALIIALGLVSLPYLLNRKLIPNTKTTR
jgi:hypothetical protein